MDLHHQQSREGSAPARRSTVAPGGRTEDVNIVLLFGCTGTGKTSFANIASGSNMEVGKGLQSSTKQLEASKVFRVDGQQIVVVDCPGFNDTHLTETEILRRLAEFLVQSYESKYKIIGLLYFHKISDTRVGGTSFRHMNMFKALCGTRAFTNAVYITNMWSEPLIEDEVLREQELRDTDEFFGLPLTKGAQMARHNNTQDSAHDIIRMLLGKGHVITKLQRQLVDEKKSLEATDVGLVIGHDLEDDLFKQQQEREELEAEKKKALEANDQIWLRRLEAQEERTRMREQQLVGQLRTLKSSRPKSSGTTNQQIRAAQAQAINSKLAAFQAQLDAKKDELMRNTKHYDDRLETYSPNQREWNERRNEQVVDEVARIRASADRFRSQAADGERLKGLGYGLLACTHAAVTLGVGTYTLMAGAYHGISSALLNDAHSSGVLPPPNHAPVTEQRGPNLQDIRRISGPVRENRVHSPGQNGGNLHHYRPEVHRGMYNQPGPPAPARTPSQFHETSRTSGQRYPPPGYDYSKQ